MCDEVWILNDPFLEPYCTEINQPPVLHTFIVEKKNIILLQPYSNGNFPTNISEVLQSENTIS